MNRLHKYYKRYRYYTSTRKKLLDFYIRKIRKLEPLDESGWNRMKELAKEEKELLKDLV
jgi:hypothetical protein